MIASVTAVGRVVILPESVVMTGKKEEMITIVTVDVTTDLEARLIQIDVISYYVTKKYLIRAGSSRLADTLSLKYSIDNIQQRRYLGPRFN